MTLIRKHKFFHFFQKPPPLIEKKHFITPKSLWAEAWQQLERGAADKRHDFNAAVLCSSDSPLYPRSRTLILRKAIADSQQLWCYTDKRSRKAKTIDAGRTTFSWTLWSSRHHLQFSASGTASWLDEETTATIFAALPKHSRKAYSTLAAPGSPLTEPGNGLPDNWEQLSLDETNQARSNFGVIITELNEVDILFLHRDGHQRIQAQKEPFGTWRMEWVVP